MTNRIVGSWLDFQHQNRFDGLYWNDQARAFSADQWAAHAADMNHAGMEYLVMMSSALDDMAFYPSRFLPRRWPLACEDPIGAVLSAADETGQRVFVSAGFYGHQTEETCDAPDYLAWHQRLTEELWARYGEHRSFHGWYIPNEAEIDGHFSDGYMRFTPRFAAHLRSLSPPAKLLIAPYGTRRVAETDRFVQQIQSLGVDYIAYQDEVGVRKTRVEELDGIYARLRRLHDRAGMPLWADVEIFEFEGAVYQSALLPAKMERIERQVTAIGPHVDRMFCYQYHGLMNPANTRAFCGHPSTVKLYEAYQAWRNVAGGDDGEV